jgi:DNA-binding NtrC family response regulator
MIPEIAGRDNNILITGEAGCGKSHIAGEIHANSKRSGRPFIIINCTAVGDTIGDEDLFGKTIESVPGIMRKVGLFDQAMSGTLYLDNLQDLPPPFQIRFTNIFRDKRFRRSDDGQFIQCDFRIIGGTTDMRLDRNETFRKDLLMLINTFTIHIPPLRQRRQDIPTLFSYLLTSVCREKKMALPPIPAELFESLMEYDWPGNTEELKATVHNLIEMSPPGQLQTQYLPFEMKRHPFDELTEMDLPEAVEMVERYLISRALKRYAGNQVRAAESLAISEAALRYKMKKYGLTRKAF